MVNSDVLILAETAIADFERSKVPGVWTGLDQQQIMAEMRARLANPFQINQGSQPFCGPATIIFELVRKHPLVYIELCRSLFQIGGFHTQTNRWISSPSYLQQTPVNFKIPQVDWMVLSTLRESENMLFSVDPNASELFRNLGGITKPWEIAGWIQEILGYQRIDYNYAYLFRDLEGIQKAHQIVKSGGVALALVNDLGLLLNQPPLISYPSHWVALLDQLNIDVNRNIIEFNIFTWGQEMQIKVDLKTFKTYFWAVVTGI